MKALAIAAANAKRMTRDRVGLFFLFVFPIVLILLLGLAFGGGLTPALGVVSEGEGRLGPELVTALGDEPSLEIERFDDVDSLVGAVERGRKDAGLIVPDDYEATIRGGEIAEVTYIASPGTLSTAVRAIVEGAVSDQAAHVRAALFASDNGVGDFDAASEIADSVVTQIPTIEVEVTNRGDGASEEVGQFDLGAASQLVLFIFLNSLAYTIALIQTRRLGVSRRMLSAPMGAGTIVLGETLGRFFVAMLQGVFIIIVAALLFGVDWGDPLAAAGLVTAFALVSTGAAMLFGAMLSNEQQAGALVPFGLALAALGGCMVPLEVFSPTMQTIAHITPHAWAVEGFTKLVRSDATITDILPQIGALLAFAVALLALASWRLRKAITS